MKKNYFFILLTFFECIVVLILAYKIFNKTIGTNRARIFINQITKNAVFFNKNSSLKYFYEPNFFYESEDYSPFSALPYKAKYSINKDTLNERFNYSIEKPKNTYRIITLGDSFTFGLFVNTKDNWTEILEDKLNGELKCHNFNKFEVINLGVIGYDLQYDTERYYLRGKKYNPDLILWFIVNPQRINEKRIPLSLQITEDLKKSGKYNKMNVFEQNYKPTEIANKRILDSLGDQGIFNYQEQFLNKMRDLYKGRLILLMEPWLSDDEIKMFIEFSQKKDNVYLFKKISDTNKNGLSFNFDGHPNQKGHQKIAEDVFNYLTKNKLVPCN